MDNYKALDLFPLDIINIVCKHITLSDILNLSKTCSRFQILSKHPHIIALKNLYIQNKINTGLELAAKLNDIKFVNFFINKYTDLNYGLEGAAIGGHLHLVEFFIKKGANNWNYGLYGAAQGNHPNLVDFFIKKGANNWNYALQGAAQGNHINLVEYFINKGAIHLEYGIHGALVCDNFDIVEYFMKKDSKYLNYVLRLLVTGYENDNLVKFLEEKMKIKF